MSYPSLRRGLAGLLTAGILAAVIIANWNSDSKTVSSSVQAGMVQDTKLDWVMYGGTPIRNMVNLNVKGLPTEWSAEEGEKKNIRWIADLGSKAYGGPTIAGGKVLIGTNNQNPRDKNDVDPASKKPIDLGVLLCFDEKTGKYNWQNTFKKLEAGRVVDWPLEGLCSTPIAENGKIYYVSTRCELICADLATGKYHWKLDMIKDLGVFPHNSSDCSPLIVDDAVWIITSNGVDEGHINVPAPSAPSFLKVNKNNGKVLWQDNSPTVELTKVNKDAPQKEFFKRLVNAGKLIQHGQWASPAAGVVNGVTQIVFPGGDGWIRTYDKEGKLLWQFDCNPKDAEYELGGRGTRNDFISTPVIYKNRVYIGVGQDPEHELNVGHLWCIDMTKKGDVSPELVTDDSVFPPKVKANPNSALVWHFGGPADAETRKKTGRNYHYGRTMSTCSIHEDICYIAELSGWVHCLDANTGKLYWQHDTKAPIWSSTYVADNKVYLGTDEGTVFVFQHGKQKKILAENSLEGRVRATPVAANGTLFILTENKLYAIAEGAGKK